MLIAMETIKVLTCEDNQDLREALTTALKDAGFEVLSASDGMEAVEMTLKHHPDVILMDILMPKMDGHEAVNKIRQDIWGKNAKIIFLTSLSDPENVVKAVEAKGDEYIIKPHASLQEIISKIRLAHTQSK